MAAAMRRATAADVPVIVDLMRDDDLGKLRETAADQRHADAFKAIDGDDNQLLAVAELDGRIVGCFQLTFIPGLSRHGAWRGQIEAVRVARDLRGRGLGRQMMQWAIDRCRERNCALVQLTSDLARADAHRFYEGLGFTASHAGFKLRLSQ
jgi:GNAT superfamily N-acetyltransferase